MLNEGSQSYERISKTLTYYFIALSLVIVTLATLHYFYFDVKAGGVYWFNLDKERNISTWFSGMLFFLFGCAAFIAYYVESIRNKQYGNLFRLPILWLGVGFVGLYMSLDEITILHENLYWREIRHVSAEFSDSWKYITQWQIIFAPAIFIVLGYFALFFTNRFLSSRKAKWFAFTGISCWIVALLLEGIRGTFKSLGAEWYLMQALVEEVLEMSGAMFLLAAIVCYILDISLNFTKARQVRLQLAAHFLTKSAAKTILVIFAILLLVCSTIYFFAHRQAESGDPVPRLFKRALGFNSQLGNSSDNTRWGVFAATMQSPVKSLWFNDITAHQSFNGTDGIAMAKFIADRLNGKSSAAFPNHLSTNNSPQIVIISINNTKSPTQIVS